MIYIKKTYKYVRPKGFSYLWKDKQKVLSYVSYYASSYDLDKLDELETTD